MCQTFVRFFGSWQWALNLVTSSALELESRAHARVPRKVWEVNGIVPKDRRHDKCCSRIQVTATDYLQKTKGPVVPVGIHIRISDVLCLIYPSLPPSLLMEPSKFTWSLIRNATPSLQLLSLPVSPHHACSSARQFHDAICTQHPPSTRPAQA